MGFFANLKGQKAMSLHGKNDYEGARKLYQEAYEAGMNDPRLLLAYSVLLLRMEAYQEARDLLVQIQKLPLGPEHKSQMYMNYAVACHKMGETARAISILERQHRKGTNGLMYQTLGYLYVEYFDASKPFVPLDPEADDDKFFSEKKVLTQEESIAKVLAYNEEAIAYDDEDPVCLDNLAQTYYRVIGDKVKAKEWFDKAIAIKENQIDTLWFLSRYDLEEGNTAAAIEKLETAAEGRFSPLNYARPEMIAAELKRLQG